MGMPSAVSGSIGSGQGSPVSVSVPKANGNVGAIPEEAGPLNWDYRYCWLRDAAFILLALMNLGYYDEARAWRDWLLRAVAGSPAQVQTLYGITGEKQLPERRTALANWLRRLAPRSDRQRGS
jgi:hypothetical protein